MKKIHLLLIVVLGLSGYGCNKDFDTLNNDPKKPENVKPDFLFAGAERQLSDIMTNSNVNSNIFRLLSQQWTETTYFDETNFDLNTRQIPQNFWNSWYIDVLKPLSDCKTKIPTQDKTFVPDAVQKNQTACTDILMVYAYSILASTYGDIPYSKALDINNVYPEYDKQATVFADLIKRLDKNIADLDVKSEAFGGNDLLMRGDVAAWKTFAYSLKLRLGMMLADADPALAKETVVSVGTNAVSSAAENIAFQYLSAPPNTNPIWVDLIQSNRKDFIATDTLVNLMTALKDPRVPAFFTNDAKGGYSGGKVGAGNNYAAFSKPGSRITSQGFEALLMDYSEVSFLLAEAVERGFISGNAGDYYNAGVRSSLLYWGASSAAADAYIAQPSVAYATAAGDWKQKIGTQKWLALYNRGWEAWTEIRRLDAPKLNLPDDPVSGFPVRYTYPTQEKNLNAANYARAAASIGGDKVETKLFWDKF